MSGFITTSTAPCDGGTPFESSASTPAPNSPTSSRIGTNSTASSESARSGNNTTSGGVGGGEFWTQERIAMAAGVVVALALLVWLLGGDDSTDSDDGMGVGDESREGADGDEDASSDASVAEAGSVSLIEG